MKLPRVLFWVALVVVLVGLIAFAGVQRNWFDNQPIAGPDVRLEQADDKLSAEEIEPEAPVDSLADVLGVEEEDLIEVGGVKRPKRDMNSAVIDLDAKRSDYLASLPEVGRAPVVPKDFSPQVAEFVSEISENAGAHPAKSPFFAPKPFDLASYESDPKAYLALVRPGRAFASVKPGAEVEPLVSASPTFREIVQGESVTLKVKASPGMPVTFHTQQLGEFDNRLKTISIAAADDGIAKVTYKAVAGVRGLVRVMAASPVHSGNLKFVVKVSLPD